MNRFRLARLRRSSTCLSLVALATLVGTACNRDGGVVTPNGGTAADNNVLVDEALSFEGSISGKVADTQSTRGAGDPTTAQTIPPDFDTANTCVRFKDIAGNDLLDPNGVPITEVPVETDGSFSADGLPVGTDFTLCADIGKDNDCDIESCVNIPTGDDGVRGELRDVVADPLTTVVLAKLRRLLETKGFDPADLPFSPAALVARIVDAYENLFEESGIDHVLTLDEIVDLTRDALAAIFDTEIPAGARTGLEIAAGNLDASRAELAEDAEALALAIAEVFLRAGFPVGDEPGAPDLGALADLENVEVVSPRVFFREDEVFEDTDAFINALGGEVPPELADLLIDGSLTDLPAGLPDDILDRIPEDLRDRLENGGPGTLPLSIVDELPAGLLDSLLDPGAAQTVPELTADDERIFVSTVSEPNRNFSGGEFDGNEGFSPRLPVVTDRVLFEMARMHLEGRSITLGRLHDLITSLDNGLGLRLTYVFEDPNFVGPPVMVFQTADGRGKAIDPEHIFARLFAEGLGDFDPDEFDQREGRARQILRELLADTIAPTFERLFDGILVDRIEGAEHLAQRIRNARVHLPFNRSGDSSFFVVADGDEFGSDATSAVTSAVTVDAEVSADGDLFGAVYNEAGTGRFVLGFTEGTDERGIVEFIVRETGRRLHGPRGVIRRSMFNDEVFAPINGEPFGRFVSESGRFFPVTHISVIRRDFEPERFELSAREFPGLHEQVPVLAQRPGFDSEPVRVDYNPESETAFFNPDGRFFLKFLDDSQESGVFALFNKATGQLASPEDSQGLFARPVDRPADFEDVFNGTDEFDDLGRFDEIIFNERDILLFNEFGEPLFDEFGNHITLQTAELVDGVFSEAAFDEFGQPIFDEFGRPLIDFSRAGFDESGTFGDPLVDEFGNPIDEFGDPLVDEFGNPIDEFGDPVADGTVNASAGGGSADGGSGGGGGGPPAGQVVTDTTADGTNRDGSEPTTLGGDPVDGGLLDPTFVDDQFGFAPRGLILVHVRDIVGLDLQAEEFIRVFGTEVPNDRYNPDEDPFFDDINDNGVQDAGEPTAPYRPTLFDPRDWRSTDIRLYYRRANDNGSITFEDVDFESESPRAVDGAELVARNFTPRLNAFRFGRPNTAVNLLTAFLPTDFFNGNHGFSRDTSVGVFTAMAMINMVMDQVFNVEADIDVDGFGPLPRRRELIDADPFVAPIDDPFRLLLRGFRDRSTVRDGGPAGDDRSPHDGAGDGPRDGGVTDGTVSDGTVSDGGAADGAAIMN